MVFLLANLVLRYFFEPIVVPILLNTAFPELSLITRLFTQDSIVTSSRYLLYRISYPIEPSKISPYAKYLLYLLVSFGFYFLDILTWYNYPREYLYYVINMLNSPIVIDFILSQMSWILEMLEQMQKKILNYMTCVCLAGTINHICKHNLKCNPKISSRELDSVMAIQNMGHIWTFLKILVITTMIKYFEKSKYMYGRILQILYDSGNLIQIPEYQRSMIVDSNENDPREIISKIITRRKWHYFYDPVVLNLILKIYQDQEGSLLQDILTSLRDRTLQFFTLWTLHGFIPVPFLAFMFRLKDPFPRNLVIPGITFGLVYLFPDRVVGISLFSEFCVYLNNSLTRNVLNKFGSMLPKIKHILCHQNKYNKYLLYSVPVVYFQNRINPVSLVMLPVISKYNFIYMYMLIFGYFSNYNFIHLGMLAIILYYKINLLDYKNTPKKSTNINVIHSYWPRI